ncbi:hypothetical protein OESDEN_02107 [Oesophagostomum dentatum]|uniref:G-protein coupled receptors family 1 profile domain-containing protein n=1 Tax=Oesophagostomum dentatum TaxID=61180 RepID=A0A0B1TR78_OESDE|nr:hypothetical protein OESDEN_02107 [Oesophagostomum dentatum]
MSSMVIPPDNINMITNTVCLYVDIFLFVICILQILANFVVLYVWCLSKRLYRNDSLILLVSLAFIDFVYAVLQFPYLIILIAGSKPDGVPFNYDPWVIVPLGGPSAALMKSGCTVTTAIAIDRLLALYFPVQYYQRSKRYWSIGAFLFAIFLAFIDWVVLQLTVTIKPVPGCSSFGCFTNELFRAYWGLSNMMMNLFSCLLTMVIVYHLFKRSAQLCRANEVEKSNRSKIDKSANRVALYILLVSALIGVVPGCLNGVGTIVSLPEDFTSMRIKYSEIGIRDEGAPKTSHLGLRSFPEAERCELAQLCIFKSVTQETIPLLLQEVSFFVGTCATLSGLSHAFIFGMAHREIKYAILTKVFRRKMDYGAGTTRVDPSTALVGMRISQRKNSQSVQQRDSGSVEKQRY